LLNSVLRLLLFPPVPPTLLLSESETDTFGVMFQDSRSLESFNTLEDVRLHDGDGEMSKYRIKKKTGTKTHVWRSGSINQISDYYLLIVSITANK